MAKFVFMLSLFCVIFFAGCGKDEASSDVSTEELKISEIIITTTPQAEADRALATAIDKAFENDPMISRYAHSFNIIVRKGRVTLHGIVANEKEREEAARVVKRFKGVTSINNQLQIIKP